MSTAISILLLHGDAEARLLADAEIAIQSVFADREVRLIKQWATRPDYLDPAIPAPANSLKQPSDVVPGADILELLEQPHNLVIFSLLPAVTLPSLRDKSGRVFLAHSGLRASWSAEVTARVAAECSEQPPLSPREAALALEPVIERLVANGSAVAVCTSFRHVNAPLHRSSSDVAGLRELIRRTNLETFQLSQRTGCFVLDFDRPLAQEGGASLNADCFGGDDRAAEIALDEFAALLMDAIPNDFMSLEVS